MGFANSLTLVWTLLVAATSTAFAAPVAERDLTSVANEDFMAKERFLETTIKIRQEQARALLERARTLEFGTPDIQSDVMSIPIHLRLILAENIELERITVHLDDHEVFKSQMPALSGRRTPLGWHSFVVENISQGQRLMKLTFEMRHPDRLAPFDGFKQRSQIESSIPVFLKSDMKSLKLLSRIKDSGLLGPSYEVSSEVIPADDLVAGAPK